MKNRSLFILGILFVFVCCKSNKQFFHNDVNIENDSINLYAFIGEKLSFTTATPDEIKHWIKIDSITGDTIRCKTYNFDTKFDAKYKVVKNIFNNLKIDTINFIVYDHAGSPRIDAYDHVILYVFLNKNDNIYYLHKNQFQPVDEVEKGIWKGKNGKTISELFKEKQNLISKSRMIFE
jgi:hypothetical protein